MGCQTSVAFGCIVLLTTSTLFFYLYFGVYLRYRFKPKGSGTYDSVLEVALAFMCVCACAFVITILLILRCLIKPGIRRQAVSPEGDKLAVNLSSVVVTSPDNRVISSKTYKTRTRISVSPTHGKIPENEAIPKILPPKLKSTNPELIINGNDDNKNEINKIKVENNETKPKEIEAVLKASEAEYKNLGKTAKVIPEIELKDESKKEMESDVKIVIEDTDLKSHKVDKKTEEKKAVEEPVMKPAVSVKSLEVPPVDVKEDDEKFWNSLDKKDDKQINKKHEKDEAVFEVASSIQMGKRPAKIEPPFKKPAHTCGKDHSKERQTKYAEKVLANFNPCFPTNKKRSVKSRGGEKPVENNNGILKTEENGKTANDKSNSSLEVKNKSPLNSSGNSINKSSKSLNLTNEETEKSFNETFTVKSPSSFKKTATDIKNKTSNSIQLDKTANSLNTSVSDIKNKSSSSIQLDKTATSLNTSVTDIKNKSSSSIQLDKTANSLNTSVTDIKNKTSNSIQLDKTANSLNTSVSDIKNKSSSSIQLDKTANLLNTSVTDIKNKSSSSIQLDKTANFLNEKTVTNLGDTMVMGKSTPYPRNGNPSPIFTVIPNIPSSENGKKEEVSEAVMTYEVSNTTKLGYWGWNYEHWS